MFYFLGITGLFFVLVLRSYVAASDWLLTILRIVDRFDGDVMHRFKSYSHNTLRNCSCSFPAANKLRERSIAVAEYGIQ